jgi:hypothetical protein
VKRRAKWCKKESSNPKKRESSRRRAEQWEEKPSNFKRKVEQHEKESRAT